MSEAVLGRIADEVLRSELFIKETLILWHAGEPCAVPPSWYRKAYAVLQSRAEWPLRFQFQTNGTLIDEEWVRFFGETGTSVTLSSTAPPIFTIGIGSTGGDGGRIRGSWRACACCERTA